MADIFVSYKKEDRSTAETLVAALRQAGKSVWWDDALNPSQAWDAMIEVEISQAQKVIVLWSPRAVQSDWVRTEAHYAQDHGKLVPVMIEPCTLPIAFMLRQVVDLSSGRFDDSNPQWTKLLSWLDGAAGAHLAEARLDQPVKVATGRRWLGPPIRPALAYGSGAALFGVLAVLSTLFLFRSQLGLGAPTQPDVIVDPFTVVNAEGLPANFAQSLSEEMFAGFASSARISPVTGDGKRHPHAYELTAEISRADDTIRVFTKLFAPGLDAPVMTAKLERPLSNKSPALELGLDMAQLVRCIAASDSINSKPTILPPEAFGPWSQYCQQITVGPSTQQSIAATLRSVVADAPNFANGWSNLAESLYLGAGTPGANKAALLVEADKAADRALAIDPSTAKALMVKGWGVIGLAGPPDGSSGLGRLHNFAQWEALAIKSISVRPSDCGCEVEMYATMLAMLGRGSAALPLREQAVAINPTSFFDSISLADLVAQVGRLSEGQRQLTEIALKWPDEKSPLFHAFVQALWRKDWATARQTLNILRNGPEKKAFSPLLNALAKGDNTGARAAGAPFLAMSFNRDTVSSLPLTAMAIAGYTDETVDALESLMAKDDMFDITLAFQPPFAAMRKTQKFAALADRMGLLEYWRMPGHRPDFCNEPDPAALCATLSKT